MHIFSPSTLTISTLQKILLKKEKDSQRVRKIFAKHILNDRLESKICMKSSQASKIRDNQIKNTQIWIDSLPKQYTGGK